MRFWLTMILIGFLGSVVVVTPDPRVAWGLVGIIAMLLVWNIWTDVDLDKRQ